MLWFMDGSGEKAKVKFISQLVTCTTCRSLVPQENQRIINASSCLSAIAVERVVTSTSQLAEN